MKFESNFEALIALINEGARDVVNDTVDEIATDVQENAPKLSGAMAASTYALKEGENHEEAFEEAKKRAKAKNPKVELEPAGLEDFSSEGGHQAAVAVPVTYAPIIHNGFSSREGRPFLEEAGNKAEGSFEARMSDLGSRLENH